LNWLGGTAEDEQICDDRRSEISSSSSFVHAPSASYYIRRVSTHRIVRVVRASSSSSSSS
tara:strand:- start:867 stop:1046 length:180 start_codon:yes stop_codon:yes gene_type:complete